MPSLCQPCLKKPSQSCFCDDGYVYDDESITVDTQPIETNGWDNCVALELPENNEVIMNWKHNYVYRVSDIQKHVDCKRAQSILGTMVLHFFEQDKNHIIDKSTRMTVLARPGQTTKILRQGNETIKDDVLGVYANLQETVSVMSTIPNKYWMTWPEKVDGIEETHKMPWTEPLLLAPAPTNHVVSPTPLLMPPPKAAEQPKAVWPVISQDKLISYNFIPAGKHIFAPTPHGLITAIKLKHGGFFLLTSKKNQATEYDNAVQLIEDQGVNGEFVY